MVTASRLFVGKTASFAHRVTENFDGLG